MLGIDPNHGLLLTRGIVGTYTDRPVIIRQLFNRNNHETITRYINEFVPLFPLAADRKDPEDTQKFGRRYAHNLPFLVDIHHQLTEYASDLFGEKVKPSYVYLSMYDKGGRCPLHIDRPQCRYTIDYLIQQESSEPWPIHIGRQMTDKQRAQLQTTHPQTDVETKSIIDKEKWTTCLLQPNDAVCYSGTNAWHYRPTASLGTADLVFFHFVPEKFSEPLD